MRTTKKYKNVVFVGDFNVGTEETPMKSFCKSYNLTSLIKHPTCFKTLKNQAALTLINKHRSFQSTCAIETGLSDFHRMIVSLPKMHFLKNFHQELLAAGIFLPMLMQNL